MRQQNIEGVRNGNFKNNFTKFTYISFATIFKKEIVNYPQNKKRKENILLR